MKLLGNVFTTFILLAVIALATMVLATRIPATHLEMKIVKSGSMEPTIPTGSLVLVAPADEYLAGDIITFGEDTKAAVPTTHRIVSIRREGNEAYLTTKGDANEDNDPVETPLSAVIGRVAIAVPYAGYVLAFAKTPAGFTLLILVPAALIILYELIGVFAEVKRMRGAGARVRPPQRRQPEAAAPSREAEPLPVMAPRFAPPRSMGRF